MAPPAKRRKTADESSRYEPSKDSVSRYLPGSTQLDRPFKNDLGKKNKVLASHLTDVARRTKEGARAAFEADDLLLPHENAGLLEAEGDLERTYRVTQAEVKEAVGINAANKSFELELDTFGPYALDYTANGRYLAIAGRRGHLAMMDWHTGKLSAELHLNETIRDVSFLHDQSFFAAAQKKYVYIYDRQGTEIHQLRNHIDVNKLEFLRFHYLLASVGGAGWLKYQDTSTGQVVAEMRTKLGSCDTMAQNLHTGIVGLGHNNGTVTLWSPNSSQPHAKLLAHLGPVSSLAYDPSSSGHAFATAGLDGSMKVWDARTWGVVNEWAMKRPAATLTFSQKGLLGVGWGNHVSVYKDATKSTGRKGAGPYMTNPFPSRAVHDLRFVPFEDLLGVGHAKGITQLLIPGAGEANYDSLEADPFENKSRRREREVHSLLDKLQPDQITYDRNHIGKLARSDEHVQAPKSGAPEAREALKRGQGRSKEIPFARKSRVERLEITGQADHFEGEDDESGDEGAIEKIVKKAPSSKRVKGPGKEQKRLHRRMQNVVDAKTEALKERIAQKQAEAKREAEAKHDAALAAGADSEPKSALDRFSRR